MEETKLNGKVSRKEARRKRNMRNTVIMAALSVALLGGATYAWFSLSDTARVTQLSLAVGEAGGLQIADYTGQNLGTYGVELKLPVASNVKLLPATCVNNIGEMYAPLYDNGNVTGIQSETIGNSSSDSAYKYYTFEEASTGSGESVYYLEKTFALKTEKGTKSNNYAIVLEPGSGWNEDGLLSDSDNATGTYILTKGDDGNGTVASAAIRISFENITNEDGVTIGENVRKSIYEPNNGLEGDGKGIAAEDTRTEDEKNKTVEATIKQDKDGEFDGDLQNTSNKSSDVLFQIAGGKTNNIIRMQIWLEGTDEQCVNEAALETLVGELKFRMIDVPTGNGQ